MPHLSDFTDKMPVNRGMATISGFNHKFHPKNQTTSLQRRYILISCVSSNAARCNLSDSTFRLIPHYSMQL